MTAPRSPDPGRPRARDPTIVGFAGVPRPAETVNAFNPAPVARRMDLDTVIGILMIVLGTLVFLGEFGVGFLLPILGIVLVVLGILMLVNVVAGGTLMGVTNLVVGLLLYGDILGVPSAVTEILNPLVGIVLIVLGILQMA